ncbi:MAG: hypothetical protein M3Z04_11650 [Chloroflexota bacterium]|nr:hypothetical protein [Chloroflexota bacterium]
MPTSRLTYYVLRITYYVPILLLTACLGETVPTPVADATVKPLSIATPTLLAPPTFAAATATAVWRALATPDRATPPASAGTPAAGEAGWLYINEGVLRFYDPATAVSQTLATVTAGGTTPPASAGSITAFTVAPAGRLVAYWQVAGTPPRYDLWLLNLKGGTPRHLAGPVACSNPQQARILGTLSTFSPDGAMLAYALPRADCTPFDLWLAATDGATPPRRVVMPEAGLILSPQWSPDSRQIAFLQAGDLGSGGVYDASIAVVAAGGSITPTLLVAGHALPGDHQALPPFDLTWLDGRTLAFQSWNPTRGPDGTWAVDTAAAVAPTLLSPAQAGLAAWSPPEAGPRRLAYRVAGAGLFVRGQDDAVGGVPLAPAAGLRGSGAISPLWSPDGTVVVFTDGAGRLSLARRAAPGPAVILPFTDPLRAGWSLPGAPPLLAVVNTAGTQITLFDATGAPVTSLSYTRSPGAPEGVVWLPAGPGLRRSLALRLAGNSPAFVPLVYDPTGRGNSLPSVPLAADSPLVGVVR